MFSISMSTEIQISHNLILCFILHALIYFFIQTHLKALETHVEYLKLRILCHDKFHRYMINKRGNEYDPFATLQA